MADEDQLRTFSNWMLRGVGHGEEFADIARPPGAGSVLATLLDAPLTLRDPRYRSSDAQFLFECLRGYMAISSAQMRGVAAVLQAGPPVQLHPLMTLIRAQAEACGGAWWLLGPLLDDDGEDASTSDVERLAIVCDVLDRSQLTRLDQLRVRLKRRRVDDVSPGGGDDEVVLRSFEADLQSRHGDDGLKWDRRKDGTPRRIIGVGRAQAPRLTELATLAVDYAYGQGHRGKGMDYYKMLSGYAHGSIEMFFSHGQTPQTSLVRLVDASSADVRKLGSLVLRIHWTLLSSLVQITGRDGGEVDAWGDEWWDSTLGDGTDDTRSHHDE